MLDRCLIKFGSCVVTNSWFNGIDNLPTMLHGEVVSTLEGFSTPCKQVVLREGYCYGIDGIRVDKEEMCVLGGKAWSKSTVKGVIKSLKIWEDR